MAPDNRKKLPLKRALEPRRQQGNDVNEGKPRVSTVRTCLASEQRSNERKDNWCIQRHGRDKGKAVARSPPPKRQRVRIVRQEDVDEDVTVTEVSLDDSGVNSDANDSSEHSLGDDDDDTLILESEPPPSQRKKHLVKKDKKRKQYVQVDKCGHPHGKITSFLIHDVKAFAKGLNPCFGWANQPLEEKQRFYDRLYAHWEVGGHQREINLAWFPPTVTKTLINVRHGLMKLIDLGEPKPADVNDKVWMALIEKRESQKSKEKSEQMRAISKGKGSKEAQMRAIEKTMIGELLGRIPYEAEVKEATEAEYAPHQVEAMKPPVDFEEEIGDLRATTSEIGGRLTRMEHMMRQLIRSLGENNGKSEMLCGVAGAEEFLEGLDDDGLEEDKGDEEKGDPDVVKDTEDNGDDVPPVCEDVAANTEVEVNCYLVENVPDGIGESNVVADVNANVPLVAVDSSVPITPNLVVEDVERDIVQSTPTVTDPYFLGPHSDPLPPIAPPMPSMQPATRQEVVNLPSSASSSQSNRVTRSIPMAKPTKFAPPKVAKAATSKGGKGSPVGPNDQPKKG